MAGANISLPAAHELQACTAQSGGGFTGGSIAKLLESIGQFLQEAGREPFQIKTRTAPLSEVESLWNVAQGGSRLVFQP
jgi:hypothetical protein